MMNKKDKNSKRRSNNILTCSITGAERMSNKDYIAAKAAKKDISVEMFKLSYVAKEPYAELKTFVEANGLDQAASSYNVDRDVIKDWLYLNGRGNYKLPEVVESINEQVGEVAELAA